MRIITSDKQLDAPRGSDLLFKGVTLSLQVSCIPIQNVGVFWADVNVLEEVVPHEGMVTLRVVSRKAHVLIHVESLHIFEGQVSILTVLNELLVATNWGAPSRKSQGEVLVWPWVELDDAVPDVLGCPLAGLRIMVQDD